MFWVMGFPLARTAVTLVMKLSMGSTVTLVTRMMNTSQVAFSSFSSSFLLSTCRKTRPSSKKEKNAQHSPGPSTLFNFPDRCLHGNLQAQAQAFLKR